MGYKCMYEVASKNFRREQWKNWLREKINTHLKNIPEVVKMIKSHNKKKKKALEKKKKSLKQLQVDLFIMTTTTVFRDLEEEGQFTITPEIIEIFDPTAMYEIALSKG